MVTESGLTGLIKLSTGDMRKALNILQVMIAQFNPLDFDKLLLFNMSFRNLIILNDSFLQSTSMAFGVIDETSVYTCTGKPQDSDIAAIMTTMLNDPFHVAFNSKWKYLSPARNFY